MPGNPYSLFKNPRRFFDSFFDIHWEDDPHWRDESDRSTSFKQRKLENGERELLLKAAQAKYAERVNGFELLDKKREWLITFSMGAVTFLVGAGQLARIPLSGWARVSFVCSVASFLVAVLILILSRRVVRFPGMMTIQELREGIAHTGVTEPEDWIAGSLHKTCEGLRVLENIVAAQVNFALVWIVFALIALVLVAFLGHPTVPV